MAVAFVSATQATRTSSVANGTTTLAPTATVAAGELLVLKCATGSFNVTATAVSGGGLTWTRNVQVPVTSSNAHANIWTARATTAGSITVTVTFTNASTGTGVIQSATLERYTGAAIGGATTDTGVGTQGGSDSITLAQANSYATWVSVDFNGRTGTPTYATSNTQSFAPYQVSGAMSSYHGYRAATATGSTAYGVTAPNSSSPATKYVTAALELVPTGTTYRRNVCRNPSAEVNANQYFRYYDVSAASRVSGGAVSGSSWFAQITAAASYDGISGADGPVVAGRTYVVSAYVRSSRAAASSAIRFAANGGSSGEYGLLSSPAALSANTWTRYSVTFTPSTSTILYPELYLTSSVAGDTIGMDAILIEEDTSVLGSYFDGGTAGGTWEDAYGNSPSYLGAATTTTNVSGSDSATLTESARLIKSWKADLTQANSNAAGFYDTPYNRQTAAGDGSASGLAWPIPTVAAPAGRPGNALAFSLPASSKRYEVEPGHTTFLDGDNYWFGMAFYLDANFPMTGSAYQVIEQLRQSSTDGSPPVAFEVRSGSQLLLTGGYGIDTATPARLNYTQPMVSGIQTGRWYNLVYRVTFSTAESTSTIDVWLDGTQVLTGFVIPPPTVIGGATYRKQGLYHDPSRPAATIYQAGQAFGVSYTEVDPTPPSMSLTASDAATLTESASLSRSSGGSDAAMLAESATASAALTAADSAGFGELAFGSATASASDSGTLAESAVLSVTLTATESAAVSDSGVRNMAITYGAVDPLANTLREAADIAADLSGSDAAVLAESAQLDQEQEPADNVAVVESTNLAASVLVADTTVLGEHAVLTEHRWLAVTDGATFSETAAVSGGGDSQIVDDATLVDEGVLTVAATPVDGAGLSETAELTVSFEALDGAALDEDITIEMTATVEDPVAVGDEVVIETGTKFYGEDGGTLTDFGRAFITSNRTVPSGTLSEGRTLSIDAEASDGASLAEAAQLVVGLVKTAQDGASLGEQYTLSTGDSFAVSDAGSMSETVQLFRHLNVPGADSGSLRESAALTVVVNAYDSASATESAAPGRQFTATDNFTATDTGVVTASGGGGEGLPMNLFFAVL